MPLPLYPTIAGIENKTSITPIWSTIVQQAASGRTVRVAEFALPLHKITKTYTVLNALQNAQFQSLIQFYNSVNGRLGLFRYVDPYISLNTSTGVYSYAPGTPNTVTELICAFDADQWEFETEVYGLWQAKSFSFTTVKS